MSLAEAILHLLDPAADGRDVGPVVREHLEVDAGHIVEQELEVQPVPGLASLHEMLTDPVLMRSDLVHGQ